MRWLQRFAIGIALLSGLMALALLMVPLLLVLLMVLFDTTAQALMVLLGLVATWVQTLTPVGGGGGLPPYRAIALDPVSVGLSAGFRSAPCLAGVVLILSKPGPGPRWWWVVLLWAISASLGGEAVGFALAPGLLAAALLALPYKPRRVRLDF